MSRALALAMGVLTLICAACGREAVVAPSDTVVTAERPEPAARRIVSHEATVLSVDVPKGLLFLRQAPSASETSGQGLTIGYAASGAAMADLKAGDRIAFDLELGDGGYVVATRKL